ncbi:MAG: GspH/FimT family pseudopilin [Lacipirellulaceae bacterium]
MRDTFRPSGFAVAVVRRHAFTLVELLIVVMILGVLAGVAAPKFTTALAGTALDTLARQMAADLRRARTRAIQSSSPVTVTFLASPPSYSSAELDQLERPGTPLGVELTSGGFSPGMPSADFGGSTSVTFDHYGEPSSDGSVLITLRTFSRTVSVDAAGNVGVSP